MGILGGLWVAVVALSLSLSLDLSGQLSGVQEFVLVWWRFGWLMEWGGLVFVDLVVVGKLLGFDGW